VLAHEHPPHQHQLSTNSSWEKTNPSVSQSRFFVPFSCYAEVEIGSWATFNYI